MPETLEQLVARVAARTGVNPEEIMSRDGPRRVTKSRFIVWWILYGRGDSYPDIGKKFHRDPTGIMYGVKKINKAYADSAQIAVWLDDLARMPS